MMTGVIKAEVPLFCPRCSRILKWSSISSCPAIPFQREQWRFIAFKALCLPVHLFLPVHIDWAEIFYRPFQKVQVFVCRGITIRQLQSLCWLNRTVAGAIPKSRSTRPDSPSSCNPILITAWWCMACSMQYASSL